MTEARARPGHRHGVDAMVGRVDNVWDRPCHDTIGDLDVCGELDAGQVSEGELPGRGGARRPRYGGSGDVVGAVDPDLCQRGADTPGHACLADDVVDHLREVTTDSHCYGAVGQADGVLRDLRGLGASMTSDFFAVRSLVCQFVARLPFRVLGIGSVAVAESTATAVIVSWLIR